MKHIMEWKLNESEIHNATSALSQYINEVTALSLPFKTESFFVKAFTDTCQVRINSVVYSVHKNYCYFSIYTAQVSEKVFVDNRYIFKPIN